MRRKLAVKRSKNTASARLYLHASYLKSIRQTHLVEVMGEWVLLLVRAALPCSLPTLPVVFSVVECTLERKGLREFMTEPKSGCRFGVVA